MFGRAELVLNNYHFWGSNNFDLTLHKNFSKRYNIDLKFNALFNFKVRNFSKHVVSMQIKNNNPQPKFMKIFISLVNNLSVNHLIKIYFSKNIASRLILKFLKHNTQRAQFWNFKNSIINCPFTLFYPFKKLHTRVCHFQYRKIWLYSLYQVIGFQLLEA